MNAPLPTLLTATEFLALPDDPAVERWLIDGQVRERPREEGTMTYRNRWHGRTEARIAQLLGNWLDRQPPPRGEVFSGEVGCLLRRDPDSIVGIDVAYFSAELAGRAGAGTSLMEGAPILAVEVLSPSERLEDLDEKIDRYLTAGVALIWVVHPRFQTVTVYRPDGPPVLYNHEQVLPGGSHLPGFAEPVAGLFGRSAEGLLPG